MFSTKVFMAFVIIGMVYCEGKIINLSKSLPNNNAQGSADNTTQIMRLLKEKCDKNGGSSASTTIEDALETGRTCYNGAAGLDLGKLDSSDEVVDPVATIRRFCSKTSQLEGCYDTTAAALRPCLAADETRYLDNAKNVLHRLNEFVCDNEAQKFLEFYSEDATTCRSAQEDAVNACLDQNINPVDLFEMDVTGVTADDLIQQLFSSERCSKLRALRTCVVAAYRQCQQPVSADFMDSVMSIALEGTPCDAETPGATRSLSRSHVSRLGH